VSSEQEEEHEQEQRGAQEEERAPDAAPVEPSPEEPPWPTNGGPLGCLLGAIAGVLLGGFLGTTLLIFYRPIAIVLTVVLMIGLAIAGWQIGRRVFKEYKPPKERKRSKR
jgi:predicted lipid-binding transport protein (Tim44 family)